MIIFLYGQDSYRLSQKLSQIIEEYKKRTNKLDFLVLDSLSTSKEVFFISLKQNSLFQEKKFFIIKHPIANKDFKEAIIANIANIISSGHNVVFYQEGKVAKNDRLLGALKGGAEIQEYPFLGADKIQSWIEQRVRFLGGEIEKDAAEFLADIVSGDLWQAENEAQKLCHYAAGKKITINNVVEFVAPGLGADIFKTIDAIAQKNKSRAIRLIKERINEGDHPIYLLAMIVSQFRNILLVKSCANFGSARGLGIHPYVLSKTFQQARLFDMAELEDFYRKAAKIDLFAKTGKIDPETGVDLLIAEL